MRVRLSTATASVWTGRGKHLALLLAMAAIFHVSVTAGLFLVGKYGLMPSQFNQQGIGNFASDGVFYQTDVIELCKVLKNEGVSAWATWPTQLHVRLYSLPLVTLTADASFNILTIEPLNLIYYLTILILVFKLGEIVFNYRTGLMAAATVAVWPSFLLHTTQLLRDPLLVSAILALMLTITLCLKRDYAWHRGILIGLAGAAAIVLIRIARLPMWPVLLAIVVLAVLFLAIRLIRARRFPIGNVAFGVMMIAAIAITPRFQSVFHNQQEINRVRMINSEDLQALPVTEQIAARRHGFQLAVGSSGEPVPSEGGSDIDKGIRFNGVADMIRHVPRAAMVGFFSPFPNMWLRTGKQVGASGRLLSGFETLLTYMIECLVLFALWSDRRQLSRWFLFLVVALGVLALGLVVGNVGALYRLRYPFWVLLVVLGAGGADYLLRRKAVASNPPFMPGAAKPTGTNPS